MRKEYGYPTLEVICKASAGNETAIREILKFYDAPRKPDLGHIRNRPYLLYFLTTGTILALIPITQEFQSNFQTCGQLDA